MYQLPQTGEKILKATPWIGLAIIGVVLVWRHYKK